MFDNNVKRLVGIVGQFAHEMVGDAAIPLVDEFFGKYSDAVVDPSMEYDIGGVFGDAVENSFMSPWETSSIAKRLID